MIEYPEHPLLVESKHLTACIEIANDVETDFTKGRKNELIKIIRESKFDVGVSEMFQHQAVVMKVFDLPLVKYNNFFYDGAC